MRGVHAFVLLLALVPIACGHAHSVEPNPPKTAAKDRPRRPARADSSDSAHRATPATEGHDPRGTSGVPIAMSPAELLKPDGIENIQKKLRSAGRLPLDHALGDLDAATREALRAFQHDNGLPSTGVPDDDTVKKLGLRPADVFRASAR